MSDIKTLLETSKITGVIIGKAFYEGTIDLGEAFKLASNNKV